MPANSIVMHHIFQPISLNRRKGFQGAFKLVRVEHIPHAPRRHFGVSEYHHDIGN